MMARKRVTGLLQRSWQVGFNGAAPMMARKLKTLHCVSVYILKLQWSRANDGAETKFRIRREAFADSFNGAAPMMARKRRCSGASRHW
mgnify:CR=1 FL=1